MLCAALTFCHVAMMQWLCNNVGESKRLPSVTDSHGRQCSNMLQLALQLSTIAYLLTITLGFDIAAYVMPAVAWICICQHSSTPFTLRCVDWCGCRMCGTSLTSELLAAVLGRQRLGGKKEVVMLPAAGGFFAYAPILKALQATHPLPLARYILHLQQQHPAATAPPVCGQVLQALPSAGAGCPGHSLSRAVDVPAYMAAPQSVYDFTPVVAQEKLKGLPSSDIARYDQCSR